MFCYSKNSSKKIIHMDACYQMKRIAASDRGSFKTLEEAYKDGYRLCRCCNPLAKQYRKERVALSAFCQSHQTISCFFHDQFIQVVTYYSKWRIVYSPKEKAFLLYHKNSFERKKANQQPVPGYHLQKVKQDTLLAYLKCIVDHEQYRKQNPIPPRMPQEGPPPPKGSKRYKEQQKQAKLYARKQSIQNVLNLMDYLQEQRGGVL